MPWPVIDTLLHWYQRWMPGISSAFDTPLIDTDELQKLMLYARSLPDSLLTFRRPSAHPLIGETPSHYRGRGLEFEENRGYQPGDEPRLLNWRLYARTGTLYSKVYTEERRPQVCILLDRRAAMRFATRRQLKVALAARIAICYAAHAQQQAQPVGGMVLDCESEWLEPGLGEENLSRLVHRLIAACPPLEFDDPQPDLIESLRLLNQRLPAGSFVLLLSDFADLAIAPAMPLLAELAARHTVQAIQILDPVERQLPDNGDFLIDGVAGAAPLPISGADRQQRARYAEAFEQQQAQLAGCFKNAAVRLRTCSTQDDPASCLDLPDTDASRR